MKKSVFIIIFAMLVVNLVGAPAAMAATPQTPLSNSYIGSYASKCSAIGKGQIKVEFTTSGTAIMDSIGASVVDIYNDTGLVYTFSMSNTSYKSQMIKNNTVAFTGSVVYSGTAGTSYYAIVTHYAAKGSGSGTEEYITNSVIA